ncbi:hypothetical protein [Cupriavidus pauculus]|uniref:hypothetical protein n=1 Tax=Cupriavidus pauculus TaxID=82633 RepID=UPI001EE39CE0|nr:hypothetical protein [Cupriavidus pauculus]GJG97331.1 hypothetical protein CBA19C6_22600 [Cupriavidus pauculus]
MSKLPPAQDVQHRSGIGIAGTSPPLGHQRELDRGIAVDHRRVGIDRHDDNPGSVHANISGGGPLDSLAESWIGAPLSNWLRTVMCATTEVSVDSPGTNVRKMALWSNSVPSFAVSLIQ